MKKIITGFLLAVLLMTACSHKSIQKNDTSVVAGYSEATVREEIIQPKTINPSVSSYMPKATAFRMSGDYSDNIAITIGNDGKLLYFPAPTDITADSKPISLGEGWWLNCQGISQNSVFTKYTFAEYAELPEVPTIEQLKNAVIPGAKVTEMIALPYTINQSVDNLNEVKEYLKGK